MKIAMGMMAALLLMAPLARAQTAPNASSPNANATPKAKEQLPGGQLLIAGKDGSSLGVCPLKHTDVSADLGGFVGRTKVVQTFENPLSQSIEAVYVFPLPNGSAIDGMTMTIGTRRIVGKIEERERARQIYNAAKAAGYTASLLDQTRPNVFVQSVANIPANATVEIEITYNETVKLQDGTYEWVFPMTVGPRFAPAAPGTSDTTGKKPKPQASPTPTGAPKTETHPALPLTIPAHDVTLHVSIEPGMAVSDVSSPTHEITSTASSDNGANVELGGGSTIPNKDFILRYKTATDGINDAFLTDVESDGAYFTLILQPPARVAPDAARPKELIFVIDRSGSMNGAPLDKAKAVMRRCIQNLNPRDTFNLLSFSFGPEACFDAPVANTSENRDVALTYLDSLYALGQTEMLPAVQAALDPPADPTRVREVCFLTDGYVDNDFEVIEAVKKHAKTARVFAFGTGNAVNRFLLDGITLAGRGQAQYVSLGEDADAAAKTFFDRVNAPVLTDISVDWGALPVADIYPKQLPDLFSSAPLLIHGRFTKPGEGTITLHGTSGSGPFERQIHVSWPKTNQARPEIGSLWARAKVADLMAQDFNGLQSGTFKPELKNQIIALGKEHNLLTQFTSFVAVDTAAQVEPAKTTVNVPTNAPNGQPPMLPGVKKPARSAGGSSYAFADGHVKALRPDEAGARTHFGIGPTFGGGAGASSSTSPMAAPSAPRAAMSAGSRRYRVAEGGGFAARGGDPLLSVEAPADSAQVVALMPNGEIKTLKWNADSHLWEARFDIPADAAAGDYAVQVVIVGKDGARRGLTLHFAVDLSAPTGTTLIQKSGANWRLSIDAAPDVARVRAFLPDGSRLDLNPSPEHAGRFEALVPRRIKAGVVTFVLTDRAHNRTTIKVDLER